MTTTTKTDLSSSTRSSSSHGRSRKRNYHTVDQDPDDRRFKNKRVAPPFIRKANISPEKLAAVEKLLNSSMADRFKHEAIMRVLRTALCGVCGGIPTYELVFPLEDAVRLERYCDTCIKRLDKTTFELTGGVYL